MSTPNRMSPSVYPSDILRVCHCCTTYYTQYTSRTRT